MMRRARMIFAASLMVALVAGCGGSPMPPFAAGEGHVSDGRWMPDVVAEDSFLEQYASTYGFRLGRPTGVVLAPESGLVYFLRSGPRSFERSLFVFDVRTGATRELLTAERLLGGAEELLSDEERARRERLRLTASGIAAFELSTNEKRLLVPLSGRLFVYDCETEGSWELPTGAGYANDAHFSPDGRKVGFVRDGDLYVINVWSSEDIDDGRPVPPSEERRLTTTASETIENGMPEFVAQEEMGRYRGYWFSPDGRSIAYQETDTRGVERLRIVDPMHPESAARESAYPRAGHPNAAVRLGVVPVQGGETKWIAWDRDAYPYLATVRWASEAPLALVVQNRAQNEELVLVADPSTGQTETVHVERDDAWINLDQAVPYFMRGGRTFLWVTERDGAAVLELRPRGDGEPVVLTPAAIGFESLLHVDEERGFAWVEASDHATEAHVYRVPLDPSRGAPERMTGGEGVHGATVDGELWVHTAQPVDGGQSMSVLRGAEVIGTLPSLAEEPPFTPALELLTVGERELAAAVVRPRNFVAGKKYPVLVSVYGGPHHRTVRATPNQYLREQWYADHGYVVVSIDGRGTPGRGREWERAIHRDVISAPLEDQVAGLVALGERFEELDMERVGIFGWSFGGYFSAHAVMQRPDVFRAGVAGAPVADWRDYDTHYTERYMGLVEDNAEGYEHASVLTHAPRLERPLLIIHGTADDNVYFMHAIKMSDVLFRHGRPHDFLPLSGFTHMVAEPEVMVSLHHRIIGLFDRALR